jgi:hypothetical protein
MRRFLTLLTFLPVLAMAAPALRADPAPVVVELFTSQGCSSCPPADAMLLDLAEREDVIALALHVDYWDYIGWEDVFADPAHTQRQKAYAYAANRTTVYTPQMVIAGETHVEGARAMAVADAIRAHAGADHGITLQLDRSGDDLRIALRHEGAGMGPARVHLVRYTPREVVEIHRGENAGRRLTYGNIVTDWQVLAEWSGRCDLDLRAPVPGEDRVVVLVQRVGPGTILAAGEAR